LDLGLCDVTLGVNDFPTIQTPYRPLKTRGQRTITPEEERNKIFRNTGTALGLPVIVLVLNGCEVQTDSEN
jgi:hypothetical protein